MKNIILNNLGFKLLALFLAIATWFYIAVELQKGDIGQREALQRLFPYRMVSKKLPIKLDLIGVPPRGYALDYENIAMKPTHCVMIGPKSLLEGLTSVRTEPIDISEHTKTFTKDISIASPIKGISVEEKFVNVMIPIEKSKD